jgi:hypothetical protein
MPLRLCGKINSHVSAFAGASGFDVRVELIDVSPYLMDNLARDSVIWVRHSETDASATARANTWQTCTRSW